MTALANKTYGSLRYDKVSEAWVVEECQPHVSIRLKQLFPKIGITAITPYRLANTDDTCADLCWFNSRYPLAMSAADRRAMNQRRRLFEERQAEIEQILMPGWDSKLDACEAYQEGRALRGYQGQMVAMTEKVHRLMVVDDIGLGKTYEGIGVIAQLATGPSAVVVQTHLPKQWQQKINEFSHLRVHLVNKTTPYDLPPADIYLFKYTQLAGWVNIFATSYFDTVVFDEVQELRTGIVSNKGMGAKRLADHARIVVGLTATPIYNYGIEVHSIGNILRPGVLGTRDEFLREWCCGHEKVVKDPEALGSYLREVNFMLRRTRKDVGKEMDPVNTIVETVDYDEQAVAKANAIAKTLAIKAMTGSFIERGRAARELDMYARQITGVSKARYVAQFVRMLLVAGESVILAGWHRDVYSIWLKELEEFKPVMYTGSETEKQKERSKQHMIEGKAKLMIISLRSGIGLDGLQAVCSVVVHGELDWSPKVHRQITGRVDREGQTSPVMEVFLVSESGSDPVIMDVLGLKSSQSKGIVDPGDEVEMVTSDPRRLRKLAEAYLSEKESRELMKKSVKVGTVLPDLCHGECDDMDRMDNGR